MVPWPSPSSTCSSSSSLRVSPGGSLLPSGFASFAQVLQIGIHTVQTFDYFAQVLPIGIHTVQPLFCASAFTLYESACTWELWCVDA